MTRHSFVQMSKLPDVKGRIDYISNPKRQEHLYATYSTAGPIFWKYLAEQAQHDFRKSNQPEGRCIEARELIIALPESFQRWDPNILLQGFVEIFRKKYGVQCSAALHHNKAKTNYHIHLVFAEREILEKTEVKYASRNMYYDESGRHVRTKKEVLDRDGKLRPGCRMLAKGEPYEMSWFSGRKTIFKSRAFLEEVKVMYTEQINQLITHEEDKLSVFDTGGPYLATKKIGKNNPLETAIIADNEIRGEWNRVVDQVLLAGGTAEEITDFKKEEVVQRVSASIREHGEDPTLLRDVIRRAIEVLKAFLKCLMECNGPEVDEKDISIRAVVVEEQMVKKGPRPDSRKEQFEFNQIDGIYQTLLKANRKLYALQKQKDTIQTALDMTPGGIFHRKERKELQERIDGLLSQIEQTQNRLHSIPGEHGYENVRAVKRSYQEAKAALEAVQRKQAEWDGVEFVPVAKAPKTDRKVSALKQLAENQRKIEAERDASTKKVRRDKQRSER